MGTASPSAATGWAQHKRRTALGAARVLIPDPPGSGTIADLGFLVGAGEGNRTLMTSLEGVPYGPVMGADLGIRLNQRYPVLTGTDPD
jgi:hypothetical protein